MDAEVQLEPVLAFESAIVAVVQLREYDDYGAGLGQGECEFRVVIIQGPGNRNGCPDGCNFPVLPKEAGTVKGLVLAEKILVRDPEGPIVTKAVVKLQKPVSSPLFGSIA